VLHGVVVTQVQDAGFGLIELCTAGLSPLIQFVQISLQILPTLKQIDTPTHLTVICKLTEGALNPIIQTIDKDIKQDWHLEEKKEKNADGGDNVGMTLLVESAIVPVHVLRTVFLEQMGRKALSRAGG